MRRLLLILGALLLASPVYAIAWDEFCSSSRTLTAPAAMTTTRANQVCASPASNSDDTEIIGVAACENIDVGVAEDEDGDGTGGSALTWQLQWCPGSETSLTAGSVQDNACVDYSGASGTGNGTVQGAGVPSGYVKIQVGGTHAGDPIIWIKCNGALR